jgi:Transposase IS66 family
LIHEELLELGIDISTGQIDRLLTEGHEQFHQEKDALLPAAREVSSYFQADDTGALFGTLMHYEMYVGQPLVSDDAGQFTISGPLHALCWLHAERSIRKLVPLSPREQEAIDGVRDAVWKYYQRLRTYRQSPTPRRKAALERDFDRLFRRRTGFADLNEALRRIREKRDDLLLVLERPEIPLHNNLSESDIREWAKKRKISAGTRSELGRRCRDTFISLKKTCRKLGVSFWRYLQDRIRGTHEVLSLPELMRQVAQHTQT